MSRSSRPTARTSFVGREDALQTLGLFADTHPIVTIRGVAGVGKTRLAREWAATATTDSRFCDLTDGRSVDDVVGAIGRGAQVVLAGGKPAAELGDALAALGPVVFVLDNADHAVDSLREVLPELLQRAPGAQFVLTSRRALGIESEIRLDLEPLDEATAIALFADRARLVRPDFVLDDASRPRVFAIVKKLDGIPLAIELATGRLTLFTPGQLLERLERPLQVLRPGPTSTFGSLALEDALEASWQELTPTEKSVFAQCSVFRGSFTVEAAEAILALPAPAAPIADVLEALFASSLLHRHAARASDCRLAMYESVRAFASDKLDTLGLREETQAKHALHFLAGSSSADLDNLLDVRRRSAERSDARGLVAATLALGPILFWCGPHAWHHALLNEALEAEARIGSPKLRCLLLVDRAECARAMGRLDAAREDATSAIRIAAEHNVRVGAKARIILGRSHRDEGDGPRARDVLQAAREEATREGDVASISASLSELAYLEANTSYAVQALALAEEAGLPTERGMALGMLGVLECELGNFVRGRSLIEQALVAARELESRELEAIGLTHLGTVQLAEQDPACLSTLEEAVRIARATGNALYIALASGLLAMVQCGVGDVGGAELLLRRTIYAANGIEHRWKDSLLGALLAVVLARADKVGEARVCHEEAVRAGADVRTRDYALTLDVLGGFIDVAEARAARRRANAQAASEGLAAARTRLERAASIPDRPRHLWMQVAVGALAFELAAAELSTSSTLQTVQAIEVDAECHSIRVPGQEKIDLTRRHPLRGIIQALVEARLRAPGVPVSRDKLVATVWPEVRASQSALNRLYNSVAMLRRMGLEAALLTKGDGYMLDPEIPLRQR